VKSDDFEGLMRKFEWFHDLTVPLDNYIVLRLDGRSFTKFTSKGSVAVNKNLQNSCTSCRNLGV
jgi:tRNA(His) 5'-end guanylyltransferase